MVNQIFNPNQIHNGVKAFIKAHFFYPRISRNAFDFYSSELGILSMFIRKYFRENTRELKIRM